MPHPGDILKSRFLEPLGISPSQLAAGLGVHRSTISRLLSGQQPLTPALAARLGAWLGVPARWFLDMQARHDAEVLDRAPDLVADVTPLRLDPDVLVTPEGVLSIQAFMAAEPEQEWPRVRRLENGSVILSGGEP